MLIVVRHGRTPANAAGLLLGRADPALDEVGEEQARLVAQWIGPVDKVVSSPLLRARQTAAAFGSEVHVDDRFIELDYGVYDGLPVGAIPAEVWKKWRNDPTYAPEGGESYDGLNERVAAGATELALEALEHNIVIVTHVSPIKSILSWSLGGVDDVAFKARVGQPSVTRITITAAGPVLHSFNEAPPVVH